MIGILLITHGTLGESLIHCASHVLNKRPPRLKQLGVTAQDDPVMLLPQARTLVKELDTGDGVLILTGVSLPMLIRVLTYRDRDLPTIVTKAISGGCEGVLRVPLFKLHNAATGS
jgi:PTS system ascorbate-specific IIA component